MADARRPLSGFILSAGKLGKRRAADPRDETRRQSLAASDKPRRVESQAGVKTTAEIVNLFL